MPRKVRLTGAGAFEVAGDGAEPAEVNTTLEITVGETARWRAGDRPAVESDDPAVCRWARRAVWEMRPAPAPGPVRAVPKPEARPSALVVCPGCEGEGAWDGEACALCGGVGVTTARRARR